MKAATAQTNLNDLLPKNGRSTVGLGAAGRDG